ncbi:phosphoenolpyruvate-utilizing N-terminal domain-containing protein [Nocardioides maradonensis]
MVTHLHGTPVVPGVGYGPALLAVTELSPDAIARFRAVSVDPDTALEQYDAAAAAVADSLRARAARASGAASEVLVASAGLATDRGMRAAVRKGLRNGDDLITAMDAALASFVETFAKMGGLMAERVTDLRDIHDRVVAHLVGEPEPGPASPDRPSVIVAVDLAPADTAALDASMVLALVTEQGGPTSHTAIIARQLGIPCVVGAAGVTAIAAGAQLYVDGEHGDVEVDPDPATAQDRAAADRRTREALASWTGPGRTADGTRVALMANVGNPATSVEAATAPVDGIGLFRTELCFLDRETEPSVEEQADLYAEVLAPFAHADQHVVVRTLDAGSDKPITYATHPDEANPALGVRGVRLAASNPKLLENQLDGIAAAASRTGADTWVMAPMVATIAEARSFAQAVRGRGLRAGVMVEVPSAALLADRILAEVDFLSIGTNDLTQYAMAADRMSSELAELTDPWQPAVLHLVATTARAGRAAGKPVGVCGEAAADPLLACVLVGLGVTSLSMAVTAVRGVGARLGDVRDATCVAMAEAALAAASPLEARAAARQALDAPQP